MLGHHFFLGKMLCQRYFCPSISKKPTTMGAFVTRLYKPDNLDTRIGLRMRAMRLIMVLLPRLGAVVERYANRDMYTSYKFQIADIIFLTLGKKIIIIQLFTFCIV